MAVLLWQAASDSVTQASALGVIGYTSLLGGLLPLIITRGRHLSWLVLFAIGDIALWHGAG